MSGSVGGISRSDFEYDHPEVLDGEPAASEGAGSEAAGIAAERTSVRPGDNFSGFHATKAVVAMDGGPAHVEGHLNRSVYGSLTIHNGEATFTRTFFGRPPEPARKLAAAEKEELAKALEREIAAGSPHAAEFRVAVGELRHAQPPAPAGRDNFSGFHATKAVVAMDGGPAHVEGHLNRSVYGSLTIHNGEATFTRTFFGRPPEPARKLAAAEKEELAKALEREIAAGSPHAAELRVAVGELRHATSQRRS